MFSTHLRLFDHDLSLFSALLAIFVTSRILKLFKGVRAVGNLPGYRVPFQPLAPPGALLPTSWWNPGRRFHWDWRLTLYKKFRSENFSVVPFLLGDPVIYTSNLDVVREVVFGSQTSSFQKAESTKLLLMKWGSNLFGSDGELWKRHRHLVAPIFEKDRLYMAEWYESLKTYRQMEADEGWIGKTTVGVSVVQKLTYKFTLLVIAKCCFGFSYDWSAPGTGPDGKISLQEAFRVLANSHFVALMMPDWVRHLPLPGFSQIRNAYSKFREFTRNEVDVRRAEMVDGSTNKEERSDIFSLLIEANERESGKSKLEDQEVIGNAYISFFLGLDTTSHTLSATLALLAAHPDIQDEIFEHIISVVDHKREPTFEDFSKLFKVQSAFYEALRLFPTAHIMIREAYEDSVLHLPKPMGQEGSTPLPVQKGTSVIVDMIGIQYNPRYFPEPESFKPSRWYNTSNTSEEFNAFSFGTRSCVGRKFTITKAVAFLAMLLRDWRVKPAFQAGETTDGWKKRVLSQVDMAITMGMVEAGVQLERRSAI